jgi:hypothetical protein
LKRETEKLETPAKFAHLVEDDTLCRPKRKKPWQDESSLLLHLVTNIPSNPLIEIFHDEITAVI